MSGRVLVAAGSAFVRRAVSDWVQAEPDMECAGAAESVDQLPAMLAVCTPDSLVLELDLPGGSAWESLATAVQRHDTNVILLAKDESDALRARDAGAYALMVKPDGGAHLSFLQMREALMRKLRSAQFDRARKANGSPAGLQAVAIVASTGGTAEIADLTSRFPADFHAVMLVAQELPIGAGYEFARRLDLLHGPRFKEAEDGDRLAAGVGFVAPSGATTTVSSARRLQVGAVAYSADAFLRSVAGAFGPDAVCIVLSGLGTDGVAGALAIREAGGCVIVGSPGEATIDALPAAALEAGAADAPTRYDALAVATLEGMRQRTPGQAA